MTLQHEIQARHAEAFARKLELIGLRRLELPAGQLLAEELPDWSFATAVRHRMDDYNWRFPRNFILRTTGPVVSVKILATDRGDVASSAYRTVFYQALTKEPWLQVLTGYDPAKLKSGMRWRSRLQGLIAIETPGGIRTDSEVIDALTEGIPAAA